MPKRISKERSQDVNQAAFQMVQRLTEGDQLPPAKITTSEISRVMAAMGRRGGQIGGKRRMATMTPEKRKEVAQNAAKARWAKKKMAEQAGNAAKRSILPHQ
jgi:hypothetical protein